MNSGNFNSKKYMIILVSVCVILMILTIKAFDYLEEPKSYNTNNTASDKAQVFEANDQRLNLYNNFQNKEDANYTNNDNEEDNNNYDEQHKTGHFDFMPKSSYQNDSDEFEEIPAPPGTEEDEIRLNSNNNENNQNNLTRDEQAIKHIGTAQAYKESNDLKNALLEYELAASTAENNEIKAMSYEAAAEINAAQRRFGTALILANKANNIAPSAARKDLITRINSKAGRLNAQ